MSVFQHCKHFLQDCNVSRWCEAAPNTSASLANENTAKATAAGVKVYNTWQKARYQVDADIGTINMDVYLPRLEQFALKESNISSSSTAATTFSVPSTAVTVAPCQGEELHAALSLYNSGFNNVI